MLYFRRAKTYTAQGSSSFRLANFPPNCDQTIARALRKPMTTLCILALQRGCQAFAPTKAVAERLQYKPTSEKRAEPMEEIAADLGPENTAGGVSVALVVAGLPILCVDEQLS